MPPAYSSLTSAVTTYNPRWETFEEKRKREERELTEWNDSHSAELCVVFTSPPFYSLSHASVFFSLRSNPAKAKEKHKFTHGKGCAELNTDRFADAEKVSKKETSACYEASLTLYCFPRARFQVESDNWVGGFYMEVYVDGWDVDKTITLDFHTPDIEFPKHACQVRPTTTTTTSHPTLSHPPPPPLIYRMCASSAIRRRPSRSSSSSSDGSAASRLAALSAARGPSASLLPAAF